MAHRRAAFLLALAIVAGTLSDRPAPSPPRTIGGYRVIAADFHVHAVLLSAWDLVFEARRRNLDAFALTPHNQIVSARIGRWVAQRVGGPTVIVGEEVRPRKYHLIAIGIHDAVSWDQPAAAAIAEVHRQGGIAIAAHPEREYWDAYDDAARRTLDGAEIAHPTAFVRGTVRSEMEQFFRQTSVAAIGSSDYHGVVPMGTARTYVFASDASEAAILDALRRHRTVVYDFADHAYGDPELIRLSDGKLPRTSDLTAVRSDWLAWVSRIAGILGLFLVVKEA